MNINKRFKKKKTFLLYKNLLQIATLKPDGFGNKLGYS